MPLEAEVDDEVRIRIIRAPRFKTQVDRFLLDLTFFRPRHGSERCEDLSLTRAAGFVHWSDGQLLLFTFVHHDDVVVRRGRREVGRVVLLDHDIHLLKFATNKFLIYFIFSSKQKERNCFLTKQ